MSNEYAGKVAVVTGASSGIGAALSQELSTRGALVALAARDMNNLSAVSGQCPGSKAIRADVTVKDDVERILNQTLSEFGRIDIWINNAGRGINRSVEQLTKEDLDEMVSINMAAALYGMQAVLPIFKKQETGVIANVASLLGRVPFAPYRSAYSAAKAGLISLTETVRMDLEQVFPRIRVVVILPNVVSTDFGLHALGGGPDSKKIPGAQSAQEVAGIIANGLLEGPLDLYTSPGSLDLIINHLKELGTNSKTIQ